MRRLIWIVFISHCISMTFGQSQESITIKRQLQFTNPNAENLLILQNINGGITLDRNDGNAIELQVQKTIYANSEQLRSKGMEEVTIEIVEKESVILIYMGTPCSDLNPEFLSTEQLKKKGYNIWQSDKNCRWRPKYDYELEYVLKVPENLDLRVSTVNEGDIRITSIAGDIKANNVNGGINIENAKGALNIHTINGDVDINYATNPEKDSKFYTLNGDIKVYTKPDLAANAFFKTFNGSFYTDLDNTSQMDQIIEKKKVKNGKGISIKVGSKEGIQIGKGGPALEFETFNGSAYLYGEK